MHLRNFFKKLSAPEKNTYFFYLIMSSRICMSSVRSKTIFPRNERVIFVLKFTYPSALCAHIHVGKTSFTEWDMVIYHDGRPEKVLVFDKHDVI